MTTSTPAVAPVRSTRLDTLDALVAAFMRWAAIPLARVGLGVVFFWFGVLKLTGDSPANELVARTVTWFDPAWFLPVLGVWEALIGLCLLDPGRYLGLGQWMTRVGVLLLLVQMPGTFLPLVTLPEVCFERVPWVPTLEGQYIIKNLVLIAAALAVGGTVRKERIRGSSGESVAQASRL